MGCGSMMKVVTIGLGYIGLPTALTFARHGAKVIGVDVSERIVQMLNEGLVPIEEHGLNKFLEDALEKKRFRASLVPEKGDVFIVAVPTPNLPDQFGSCDLYYIEQALRSISPYLEKGNTVIIESTIAPRTMEDVIQPFLENAGFLIGEDLFLVHCPERVLPGKILHELIFNNRIIGGMTEKCTAKGKEIYGLFVQGELLEASASVAELSKLMENTFRDVNIALANELVNIGSKLNINALEVIEMANKHPRVNIHQPGPGVGGHCLAVDPYFIIAKAPEETSLIQQARHVNKSMPRFVAEKVLSILQENNGSVITLLGLSYKGNIDDIRESPAVEVLNELQELSTATIQVFDPHIKGVGIETLEEAMKESDLAVILCDHDEFKEIPEKAIDLMNHKVVFDTKHIVAHQGNFDKYYTFGNISTESGKLKIGE